MNSGIHEPKTARRCCGECAHFSNAPAAIEAAFVGLSAMSSGYGSVRGQDGLCDLHGLYLTYRDCCADFSDSRHAAPGHRVASAD